ncbi:MAG: type II secretion system protein [Polyangiaceae bacterium]|nr:type II secretion system protein [Polyangiaceae bacterium]
MTPQRRRRRSADDGGFTLLEVMVAVAILGLSLTVILSSQVGLFSSGTYAQHLGVATGLARCKMSELEEQFAKLGYPEVDTTDEGPCCAGDLRGDMKCSWKIERIELPTPPLTDPLADGGLPFGGGDGGNMTDPSVLSLVTDGGMPPMGGTAGLAGLAGGGMQGMMAMAMAMVYPALKPMLEASIRKVTLKVEWREGLAKRDLEVLQWVTNPSKGGFLLAGGSSSGLPFAGMPPIPGMPTSVTPVGAPTTETTSAPTPTARPLRVRTIGQPSP